MIIYHLNKKGVLLTALLLIAFQTQFAFSDEANLSRQIEALNKESLPGYTAKKLEEISQCTESFNKNFIITLSEEDSLHELIRILATTTSTYRALNHYVFGWNTIMEYQYRANIEAVKRGIDVSRTFIISDDVMCCSTRFKNLLQILDIQKKDGIKVYYGLQRELEKDLDYHKYVLMDAGLSDDSVFVKVTAVSIKGPQPARVIITWDKKTVQDQNPFPYLKKSPYIYPYDDLAKKRILEISRKTDCME